MKDQQTLNYIKIAQVLMWIIIGKTVSKNQRLLYINLMILHWDMINLIYECNNLFIYGNSSWLLFTYQTIYSRIAQ